MQQVLALTIRCNIMKYFLKIFFKKVGTALARFKVNKSCGVCGCVMDNAVYIALSRQAGLFRQMDVIANNVANVDTPAYKAESILFNQYLTRDVGGKIAFAYDRGMARDVRQGPMRYTGRPLDMAVDGAGYFAVDTPLGKRFTRAGNFIVNGANELSTTEGYAVLDSAGQSIVFEEQDDQFVVREDGTITVGKQNEERGVVGVFVFDNERALKKLSNNLYIADDEPLPALPEEYRVAQGMLEGSNVQAVTMMTELIKTSRDAGNVSRILNDLRDLESRTISAITRQQQ